MTGRPPHQRDGLQPRHHLGALTLCDIDCFAPPSDIASPPSNRSQSWSGENTSDGTKQNTGTLTSPWGCQIDLYRVSARYRYRAASITIAWVYLTPQTSMWLRTRTSSRFLATLDLSSPSARIRRDTGGEWAPSVLTVSFMTSFRDIPRLSKITSYCPSQASQSSIWLDCGPNSPSDFIAHGLSVVGCSVQSVIPGNGHSMAISSRCGPTGKT